MDDVFGAAMAEAGGLLRDAAIAAGHDLGLFTALARAARPMTHDELAAATAIARGRHRLRALVDVLAALGVIEHRGDRFASGHPPARPAVPASGWGLLASVIRTDRPLPVDGGDAERRLHRHLATAGADAARELAPLLAGPSLLDLGGGAGAYTAAFLAAHPAATATLVDTAAVVELARAELARFGGRVRFVAGDARTAELGGPYGAALLCNVLHFHDAAGCAALCAAAARAVAPGGRVVIKDLRVDDDRSGPLAGLLFALGMAVYSERGDVHATATVRAFLAGAGLDAIEARRLAAADDAIVVIGHAPLAPSPRSALP